MRFHDPLVLLLALPWLFGWALFARSQKQALSWVLSNVSERFRSRFSVHDPRSLRRHLRLLAAMGLLLIAGGAGPYLPGAAEIEAERARVVLLLDASASMYATDLEAPEGETAEDGPQWNRFAAARELAEELIRELPETSFAIASFSGSVAVHSPMTADRTFLMEALRSLEIHGQYQNSGSSLGRALDGVFDFQDPTRPNLQAVILGDGEQPEDQPVSLEDALAALGAQSIPVHTVAIGSLEGQGRRILDFRDIVAKKEDPAVLQSYHTRRVDTELRRISEATGGAFDVLDGESPARISAAIRGHRSPPARIERSGSGTDLAVFCLLGFLVAFLADGLWIGRHAPREPMGFDLSRIGRQRALSSGGPRQIGALLVGLSLLFSGSCSNTPRAQALRENEKGIALDALGRRAEARVHYKRSMGYGVETQIPAFNLARSIHKEGDYSQAHELYQEALKIDPELPEAYYNDGIALFDWGEAERDPKGCQLERTRELWTRALERLAKAVSLTSSTSSTGRRARANHRHLKSELMEIERLIADPPPECLGGGGGSQDESEGAGGGSGGGEDDPSQGGGGSGGGEDDPSQGGGGSGGGGEDDPSQGGGGSGGGGEDDPSQGGGGSGGGGDDPSQGGSGGPEDEGEDQSQGGGGSEDEGDDPSQGGGAGSGGDDRTQGGGSSGGEGDPSQGGGESEEEQDQGGGADGQGGGGLGDEGDHQDQGGGGSGGGESDGRGSGGGSLSPEELEQIRQELERIGRQALEEGKYHRRTLPEQFGKEHWANPDRVIWW